MKVKIVNKSKYELPKYARPGDSGVDIHANIEESIVLKPFERILIPTGLFVDIPEGWEIQVRSRSGEVLKKGLTVLNSPGTVDSGYTGEIGVILYNSNPTPQIVEPGERVAQLILCQVGNIEFEEKDEIKKQTERGATGYGTSGRF